MLPYWRKCARQWIWLLQLAGLSFNGSAQINSATNSISFAQKAERAYLAARQRCEAEPTNSEAAWQLGRECFAWAEFATNHQQRAAVATEGIRVCRQLAEHEPRLAAAHYYLALNLGQLARTKSLGALKIVDEMEREFKTARFLDESFDYAGPDRSLGLLYRDAPGWPASIGSRSKARQHLSRAVELSQDYPENHLCLLETYLKWGEKRNVRAESAELKKLIPKARKQFAGESWAASWQDWDQQWERMLEKIR